MRKDIGNKVNEFCLLPKIDYKDFDSFIVSGSDSVFNNLDEVLARIDDGKVLFDMLFHNGNNDERFIEGVVKDGKFVEDAFAVFKVGDKEEPRRLTVEIACQLPKMVKYSSLSKAQKELILGGVTI